MPRNKKERSREKDKEEGEERERKKGGGNPVEWNCFMGRVAGTLRVNRARRDN